MERERERESRISDGEKVFANFLEKIEKKSQEPHSHFGNVASNPESN